MLFLCHSCRSLCQIIKSAPHFKLSPCNSRRYFTDYAKQPQANAHKKKAKTPFTKTQTTKEISYQEESDAYLSKELQKALKAYKSENREMRKITSQFTELLKLYQFEIVKSPLIYQGENEIIENCRAIHLSKSTNTGENLDIVIDAEKSFETSMRDVQLLISNQGTQLLYLTGVFGKEQGMLFDSAMLIDTVETSHSVTEFRHLFGSGNPEIFKLTHNKYLKLLASDDSRLIKFVTTDLEEIEEEFDGRILIDSLLNFFAIQSIGVKSGSEEGDKLISILWMYATYMENVLQGQWISNFSKLIENK